MDYQQISFFVPEGQQREVLIALLDEAGFEAYEESPEALLAFIPADRYEAALVTALATRLELRYEAQQIAPQNWNAKWEADFQPVVIPGFCTVRAAFHELPVTTPYEIIVTPKMSFGTGHHATTQMMLEGLQGQSLKGQQVLDFGTGTGILAILADQLGADRVLAIDNDEWSVANAQENVEMNGASHVTVIQGSLEAAGGEAGFHLILANINRHILLQYMGDMNRRLAAGGQLILSGILAEDEPVIGAAAAAEGLNAEGRKELNNWLSLRFRKA